MALAAPLASAHLVLLPGKLSIAVASTATGVRVGLWRLYQRRGQEWTSQESFAHLSLIEEAPCQCVRTRSSSYYRYHYSPYSFWQ